MPAHAETTHPFLTSFNGSDTPTGSFRVAGRVGVDQGTGDVYVVDISSVFAWHRRHRGLRRERCVPARDHR